MRWEPPYNARFLQRTTMFRSLDRIVLQSTSGTALVHHHILLETLLCIITPMGTPHLAPHLGREVAHNDGPVRAILGEAWATRQPSPRPIASRAMRLIAADSDA